MDTIPFKIKLYNCITVYWIDFNSRTCKAISPAGFLYARHDLQDPKGSRACTGINNQIHWRETIPEGEQGRDRSRVYEVLETPQDPNKEPHEMWNQKVWRKSLGKLLDDDSWLSWRGRGGNYFRFTILC